MSKSIQEYLPIKHREKTMVQCRVATVITDPVKKIMEKENLSWSDLITACLRQFLNEKARVAKKK